MALQACRIAEAVEAVVARGDVIGGRASADARVEAAELAAAARPCSPSLLALAPTARCAAAAPGSPSWLRLPADPHGVSAVCWEARRRASAAFRLWRPRCSAWRATWSRGNTRRRGRPRRAAPPCSSRGCQARLCGRTPSARCAPGRSRSSCRCTGGVCAEPSCMHLTAVQPPCKLSTWRVRRRALRGQHRLGPRASASWTALFYCWSARSPAAATMRVPGSCCAVMCSRMLSQPWRQRRHPPPSTPRSGAHQRGQLRSRQPRPSRRLKPRARFSAPQAHRQLRRTCSTSATLTATWTR